MAEPSELAPSQGIEPGALFLATSDELLVRLSDGIAMLPWSRGRHLQYRLITGDVRQDVAAHRERAGSLPIGVVAVDQATVLAALAGGADEAAVVRLDDPSEVSAFVDRLQLRASMRADMHRLHVSFAHAEKLTALGTLVAGVGHEINNPLSALMLSISALRRRAFPAIEAGAAICRAIEIGSAPSPDLLARLHGKQLQRTERDLVSTLDEMNASANAIASIVRDLRVFARTDDHEAAELVDVAELIDHVLRLLGRDVSNHGLLVRDYAPNLPNLVVPRNRLAQVITNLLVNAAHAIAEVERETHCIRVAVRADDEFLAITVTDTGPGIDPEALERIFDPFFTTKRQELGTGLGLSIPRSILQKLGGDVTVDSIDGEGATFICFLPLPSEEVLREASRRTSTSVSGIGMARGKNVLVVDDDPRMLRSYARLLNAEHRILIAHDAHDAIELLETGSTPDLVVLELDLPSGDGPQLLAWLSEHRPQLAKHTLFVTSADAELRYSDLLRAHRGRVLWKPVQGETLLAAIAALDTELPAELATG